jgi:hypothetical protein
LTFEKSVSEKLRKLLSCFKFSSYFLFLSLYTSSPLPSPSPLLGALRPYPPPPSSSSRCSQPSLWPWPLSPLSSDFPFPVPVSTSSLRSLGIRRKRKGFPPWKVFSSSALVAETSGIRRGFHRNGLHANRVSRRASSLNSRTGYGSYSL